MLKTGAFGHRGMEVRELAIVGGGTHGVRHKKASGFRISRCADLASVCAKCVGAAHSAHPLGIMMRRWGIELWYLS
jgi:hypothetical protein